MNGSSNGALRCRTTSQSKETHPPRGSGWLDRVITHDSLEFYYPETKLIFTEKYHRNGKGWSLTTTPVRSATKGELVRGGILVNDKVQCYLVVGEGRVKYEAYLFQSSTSENIQRQEKEYWKLRPQQRKTVGLENPLRRGLYEQRWSGFCGISMRAWPQRKPEAKQRGVISPWRNLFLGRSLSKERRAKSHLSYDRGKKGGKPLTLQGRPLLGPTTCYIKLTWRQRP